MINPNLGDELKRLSRVPAETREVERKLASLARLASTRPQELLPHVEDVARLLDSASAAVQASSLETLTMLSRAAPGAMAFLLPRLHELLANEPQNRHFAVCPLDALLALGSEIDVLDIVLH